MGDLLFRQTHFRYYPKATITCPLLFDIFHRSFATNLGASYFGNQSSSVRLPNEMGYFNFRRKDPDSIYEKTSTSSEDGYASDEAQAFLVKDRRRVRFFEPRKCRLSIVSLVSSAIVNVILVGFIAYGYAHRGANSPLFPQLVYCKLTRCANISKADYSPHFSTRKRGYQLRNQDFHKWLWWPKNKVYGRQLQGRR